MKMIDTPCPRCKGTHLMKILFQGRIGSVLCDLCGGTGFFKAIDPDELLKGLDRVMDRVLTGDLT